MHEQFNLRRFVEAQDGGGVYLEALKELRAGSKQSHWMWFIFPQVAGLGRSSTSRHFAISGAEEAKAYLQHEILGARLRECAGVLMGHHERKAEESLGEVDAQKLRSSMTLFAQVAAPEQLFQDVLDRYFGGQLDQATVDLLTAGGSDQSSS